MKFRGNPKVFGAMAALAILGGGFGAYTQMGSMSDIEGQSDAIRKQLRDETEVKKQLEETAAKLSETSAKLDHLEKGVPQFAYLATMLKELDQTGRDCGIEVLGVRPVIEAKPLTANTAEEKKERKPYQEMNIEVKGRGDYRALMSFVQALQRFPKIVAAKTISISPKNEPGKPLKLDISIELKAFLFPPTQPALQAQSSEKEARSNG